MPDVKDPVRQVNQTFLSELEVLSNKEMPLPGARIKGGERDQRFLHLVSSDSEIVAFNHLATVRHRPSSTVFVVFRQTIEALYFEQKDPVKYPTWLMDSDAKKAELSTYIHIMKPAYAQNPNLVLRDSNISTITRQTRVDKWLDEIGVPWVFDTVAYYLLKNNIISQEMYGKIK